MTDYKMPNVYPGQVVIWYAAIGAPGAPAIVTEVGARSLHLAVFSPGFQNAMAPDGVLHIDDPEARKQSNREEGVWDFTEGDKQLQSLLSQLTTQQRKTQKAS